MRQVLKCVSIAVVIAGLLIFNAAPVLAQSPEGFGSATTGGAGYPVVLVTTLEDYDPSVSPAIVGSLRWALSGENRQVHFSVGGNIDLKVKLGIRGKANVTVDGSTAPYPGITLRYDQLEIRDGATNVIVRHIRMRDGADRSSIIPGISIYKRADRIWIDHCSVTRASDESIGVYGGAIGEGRPTNVTLSWNLIADAIVPTIANSGKGILVGGPGSGGPGVAVTGEMADRVTIHHNVLIHNDQRNPQISGNTNNGLRQPLVDMRDNIIDGWTNYGSRWRWAATGNIVKNIFTSPQKGSNALIFELPGAVYTSGNVAPPQGTGGVDINAMGTSATPIAAPAITEHAVSALPAALLGDGVTTGAGALPRDAYDTAVATRLAGDLRGWLQTCSQRGGTGCQAGEMCVGGAFGPSSDYGSLCCVGGTCGGSTPGTDTDGDGVPDATDNCPAVVNPGQADLDGDGIGDACDSCPLGPDSDRDGVCDTADNCVSVYNPAQTDTDLDGTGDACDQCPAGTDSDGDGVCDTADNCVSVYNPAQTDTNRDGIGDACDGCGSEDRDRDADGFCDRQDNCPLISNPGQADTDGDGLGDACDPCPLGSDSDRDGVCDAVDNCVSVYNPAQTDTDLDGTGDACDQCPAGTDSDGDGVCNTVDNCVSVYNPAQTDTDRDGTGDACDQCPAGTDSDGDGVCDTADNCVSVYNPAQTDTNRDGIGDACDGCGSEDRDRDADGFCDRQDNCPLISNPGQADADGDGLGDACDPCPLGSDSDRDGVCDTADNCVSVYNPAQTDTDRDGTGDACDQCPAGTDSDGDGVCDTADNCVSVYNPAQTDTNRDGIGDACDGCGSEDRDRDADGFCDRQDNCPLISNPGQADTDGDGLGDACDPCPLGSDSDRDGVCDAVDNCVSVYNPAQTDTDLDGTGDACDLCPTGPDSDTDGVCDAIDNCVSAYNPGQSDSDGDGVGDSCDRCLWEDDDGDGICDGEDNCPTVYNPGQGNSDGDVEGGDACDITILFPLSGEITCADPPPTITWSPATFDRFRVIVGADPTFSMRIASGQEMLRVTSWTVPHGKWTTICARANPNLYFRVMGKIAGTDFIDMSETVAVRVK